MDVQKGRYIADLGGDFVVFLIGYAVQQALENHVQYWRSFEELDRFARDTNLPNLEPWRRFKPDGLELG